MPIEAPIAAGATTQGAAAGFGTTLSGVGIGAKTFVLAHPVALAAVGGVLLGLGAYHGVRRWRNKPTETEEVAAAA